MCVCGFRDSIEVFELDSLKSLYSLNIGKIILFAHLFDNGQLFLITWEDNVASSCIEIWDMTENKLNSYLTFPKGNHVQSMFC